MIGRHFEDDLMTLNLLHIRAVLNNIKRVSEVSKASKSGQVSQPVRGKQAGARGPVHADSTV